MLAKTGLDIRLALAGGAILVIIGTGATILAITKARKVSGGKLA